MNFSLSRLQRLKLKYFPFKDKNGLYIAPGSKIINGTTIGTGTRINGKINIKGSGKTTIGNFCAIGEDIRIISSNHDMNAVNIQYALHKKLGMKAPKGNKKNVDIGHNVWIGDAVIILPGVTIGNGAVLAAGSIITKDVQPYSVVGGTPAKHIKFRFTPEKIREIENSKWWEWPLEKMIENKDFLA